MVISVIKNNKGFVVSTVLYGVLIVFFLVVTVLMSIIISNRNSNVKLSKQITEELNDYSKGRERKAEKPELINGMVPVYYDASAKAYKKADESSDNWYDYGNLEYALSVTLNEEAIKNISVDEIIGEEDINAFWVWVPRFSYKANGESYDIKWINNKTTDISNELSSYNTPFSFCTGSSCSTNRLGGINAKELNGIWISEYKVSLSGNDQSECNPGEELCDAILNSLQGKTPWMNVSYDNLKKAVNDNVNTNGLTNYNLSGNYEASIITNNEWDLIAILAKNTMQKGKQFIFNDLQTDVKEIVSGTNKENVQRSNEAKTTEEKPYILRGIKGKGLFDNEISDGKESTEFTTRISIHEK